MDKENQIHNIRNPHDKLFRETWCNPENTCSFLQHFLPDKVEAVMEGIKKIKKIDGLIKIKEAIKTAHDASETMLMIEAFCNK